MKKRIGMIGLGCPKNQVDAELMLAKLQGEFEIVDEVENADLVIINTCGFIDAAKQEAIETILTCGELKQQGVIKKILVTGCLAERYQNKIREQMPEVDGVIGLGKNGDIVNVCRELLGGENISDFPDKYELPLCGDRILSTAGHFAYLKIAEGCSNNCTYCAIPSIRGKMRSRPIEELAAEAKTLAENGVKELVIIAQDVTKYGLDLYHKLMLPALLEELCKIDGLVWIRLLYCYPDCLTDELIDTIARQEKICNYIDLPLQHADKDILRRMHRAGDEQSLLALVEKLRGSSPASRAKRKSSLKHFRVSPKKRSSTGWAALPIRRKRAPPPPRWTDSSTTKQNKNAPSSLCSSSMRSLKKSSCPVSGKPIACLWTVLTKKTCFTWAERIWTALKSTVRSSFPPKRSCCPASLWTQRSSA